MKYGLFRTVRLSLGLLLPQERLVAVLLAVATGTVELLLLGSMMALMPLISVVAYPDTAARLQAYLPLDIGGLSRLALIVAIAAAAGLLAVLGQVGTIWRQAAWEAFVRRIHVRLSDHLVTSVMDSPYPWLSGQSAPALARILYNDLISWSRDGVLGTVRMAAMVPVAVLTGAFILGSAPLDGLMVVAVALLLLTAAIRMVRPRQRAWVERKRVACEVLFRQTTEMLNGVRDIKLSHGARAFTADHNRHVADMTLASGRMQVLGNLPSATLTLAGYLALLVLAVVLSLRYQDGQEAMTRLTTIFLMTSRLLPVMGAISTAFSQLFNAAPWIEGLHVLDRDIQNARKAFATHRGVLPPPPDWPAIILDGVSFAYGDRTVFTGVDLSIERGGVYGIAGPSGSGKSTLVDLLLGLQAPTTGRILVGSADLSDIDPRQWHARIGYVPQTPNFIDGTIRENIVFGHRSADEERLADAIRLAGLWDMVAALPQGVDTPVGDRALHLSGGQRQRVALARALYKGADLLVLDEATANLDPETEQFILGTITSLRGRCTVLVIAHQDTALARCDLIIRVEGTRCVVLANATATHQG